MENKIQYSIAALCDKAGRAANQDNFWVCPDLSQVNTPLEGDDKLYTLSDLGALIVVADGMGGMKSGEVASQIVIDSIKARFSAIPPHVLSDETQIKEFMRSAVVDADNGVKAYSREHPESHGMGSTVVMCWIVNNKAFIGWTGDSRAYVFNPRNRIERLSHDHSYVQLLVDNEQITEEESFHHPQGNVITHSVGDTEPNVHFDILSYPVHKEDIFLLCSDGLCGLLNDETLESYIRGSYSMEKLLAKLWEAGCAAGWTDNTTIELLRIQDAPIEAGPEPEGWKQIYKPAPGANRINTFAPAAQPAPAPAPAPGDAQPAAPAPHSAPAKPSALDPNAPPVGTIPEPTKSNKSNNNLLMMIIGALVALVIIAAAVFFLFPGKSDTKKDPAPQPQKNENVQDTYQQPQPPQQQPQQQQVKVHTNINSTTPQVNNSPTPKSAAAPSPKQSATPTKTNNSNNPPTTPIGDTKPSKNQGQQVGPDQTNTTSSPKKGEANQIMQEKLKPKKK